MAEGGASAEGEGIIVTKYDRDGVEKIVSVDVNFEGEIVFTIKFMGLDKPQRVMGDEANKKCPDLVMAFYEKMLAYELFSDMPPEVLNPFDKGLEPEKITNIGTSSSEWTLWVVVKWKGLEKTDLVRLVEAKRRCPKPLIEFYEERFIPLLQMCNIKEAPKIGFGRGLQVEKIIKMGYDMGPELQFWIKWINCRTIDQVSHSEAIAKCPQEVIDYYISILPLPYDSEMNSDDVTGLKVEKLVGVRHTLTSLLYLVTLENLEGRFLVKAANVDKKFPKIVIDFLDTEIKKLYPLPGRVAHLLSYR